MLCRHMVTKVSFAATVMGCLFIANPLHAKTAHIAVASNFFGTARAIAARFNKKTGHQLIIISGSTGKLYAQIINGAPFDAFFAADATRPRLLEKSGKIVKGTRFTYAIGRLVLWSPDPALLKNAPDALRTGQISRLSIANPKLAPYGLAARQVLQRLDVWKKWQGKVIRGENIVQALQFVKTHNAEAGFVSLALIKRLAPQPDNKPPGSYWLPASGTHQAIVQQAVRLTNNEAARELMAFVRSQPVRQLIKDHGYSLISE